MGNEGLSEQKRQAWTKWTSLAFTVLLALYAIAVVAKIAMRPDVFQVNFRVYYYSAQAFTLGLDPYDSDVMAELAGGKFVLPCIYPPMSLNVFRPLALFEFLTAYRLFVVLKFVALAFCLWLWHRKFLETGVDNVFLIVCLIGFNYCIYWDFQAGNISILAQTLLWLGFFAYVRGRLGWFILCTVAASVFKLTPIFFLILLVVADHRKKWAWLAVGCVAFGLMQLVSAVAYPDLSRAFLESMSEMQGLVTDDTAAVENFEGAPATWPLVKVVFSKAGAKLGRRLPGIVPVAAFAALMLAVFGVTWWTLRQHPEPDPHQRRILLVMLACLLYLIVTPRLMVYTYVIGLLPAYYVIRRLGRVNAALLLIVLMIPAPITGRAPGFKFLFETATNYYPLFVVYILWALCMVHLWTARPNAGDPDENLHHA